MIRRVFRNLAERNIIFNLKKSTFLQPKAEYLGYFFDHEGVSPNKNIQKVIDELTTPTNKNDLQKVLGILNYHLKFIPNYSHKVNPLNKLLHGKARHEAVNWQSKHTQILDEIRKELQGQVILQQPRQGFSNVYRRFSTCHRMVSYTRNWKRREGNDHGKENIDVIQAEKASDRPRITRPRIRRQENRPSHIRTRS